MKISQNSSHRFNIEGIKDPGKTNKKGKVKTGIAGYKCKALGWILEKIFKKAVGVKTAHGTVYLNRKSLEQWLVRVKPGNALSKNDLEKISKNPRRAERAVEKILYPKQPAIPKPQVFMPPQDQFKNSPFSSPYKSKYKGVEQPQMQVLTSPIKSPVKVPDLPLIPTAKPADDLAVKKFFGHFNDENVKEVFNKRLEEMYHIYMALSDYIVRENVEIRIMPFKKKKDTPDKSQVVYVWIPPVQQGTKSRLNLNQDVIKTVNSDATPSKDKGRQLMRFANQLKEVPYIKNQLELKSFNMNNQ